MRGFSLPRGRQPGKPAGRFALFGGVVGFGFVLVLTAFLPNVVAFGSTTHSGIAAAKLPNLVITDGIWLTTTHGLGTIKMFDAIHSLPPGSGSRGYTLTLSVVSPLRHLPVLVQTNPILQWSNPFQRPGGADNLPPFPLWHWTVTTGGVNDTANWTLTPSGHQIQRTVVWVDQTFVIRGSVAPVETVTVPAKLPAGYTAPQVGLFLQYPGAQNASIPTTNPTYRSLVTSLNPQIVRISLSSIQTFAFWNNVTRSPVFNFTAFDKTVNFSRSIGAAVVLSIPVGTWGDGNNLPYNMPLNTQLPLTFLGTTGYFPTGGAYQRFVDVLVAHVVSKNESVKYWNVGNEQPLQNASIVGAYESMFNIAEAQIHAKLPNALVGSDVLTNRTYLTQFANNLNNVGFLSYHFYPAVGYCVVNGSYCPPAGGFNGTQNSQLMKPIAELSGDSVFYAPQLAREMWFNITGHWLPAFDTETNLNAVGGAHTTWVGTDPRDQMLFGAAWLIDALLQGATQNVSSLTYFTATDPSSVLPSTVTSQFGGWGFGLARPTTTTGYVHYAPYWALKMWAHNVPAGSVGAVLPTADPTVVQAYADQSPGALNVVLVNLAAVPVQVPIVLNATGYQTRAVHVLDSVSYIETFNSTTQTERLSRSGVTQTLTQVPTVTVTIAGYGVAAVEFVKLAKGPVATWDPDSPANDTAALSTTLVTAAPVPAPGTSNGLRPAPAFGVGSLVVGRANWA